VGSDHKRLTISAQRLSAEHIFRSLPGLSEHITIDAYIQEMNTSLQASWHTVEPLKGAAELVQGLVCPISRRAAVYTALVYRTVYSARQETRLMGAEHRRYPLCPSDRVEPSQPQAQIGMSWPYATATAARQSQDTQNLTETGTPFSHL
jgi:hypothetical protein